MWITAGLKLLPLITGAVHLVEKLKPARTEPEPAKGSAKQDAAVEAVKALLVISEDLTDRDLLNDAAVEAATRSVIDAYVNLQNVIATRPPKG